MHSYTDEETKIEKREVPYTSLGLIFCPEGIVTVSMAPNFQIFTPCQANFIK